jgi:succinoglycan biosynthesis transport protein ExoP
MTKAIGEFSSEPELDIYGYLRIILRRRRLVVLVTLLFVSFMAAYAFLSKPVYRATALISVDKVASNDIAALEREGQNTEDNYLETQFKLVASESQLRRVYQELELGKYEEFADGLWPLRSAITVLPVPRTRLCTVNVESLDPRLAAAIAGALARAFVKKNLDNQLFMSKNVLGALQARTRDSDSRNMVESLPAIVNSKLIQDIKTQIFSSEAALADLRTKYTANYPAVQALQSRIDSMRKVLNHEMENILGALKTELSGQLRANNVRIVDEPTVPAKPVRPRKVLALLIGLVVGLAFGVVSALLNESFDQTILTHHDVERRLGMPFLGQIPLARRQKGALIYAPLVSGEMSPSSEAFRNLRTIVGLANKSATDPFLLVTSTVQAEGKSFVSTNLAVALAQLGHKVLIVDGDLRKPNQHLNLASAAKIGLSDYLAGGIVDAGHVAQKTGIPNLDLVVCGTRSKNPAELLNSEPLARFVHWARSRYTRIIVDCPPVFPVSDVLLWGRHVNSTIFVARYGLTRVPLIQTACARLRVGGVRIIGGVINAARIRTTRYADGRYPEQY